MVRICAGLIALGVDIDDDVEKTTLPPMDAGGLELVEDADEEATVTVGEEAKRMVDGGIMPTPLLFTLLLLLLIMLAAFREASMMLIDLTFCCCCCCWWCDPGSRVRSSNSCRSVLEVVRSQSNNFVNSLMSRFMLSICAFCC